MTTTTRERPVILTPAELREALAGTLGVIERPIFRDGQDEHHMPWRVGGTHWQDGDASLRCPFGEPGTVLVGKETWRTSTVPDEYGLKRAIEYRADGAKIVKPGHLVTSVSSRVGGSWKSPAMMPRWAARLFLENLAVFVVQVDGQWRWRGEVRRVGGEGRDAT